MSSLEGRAAVVTGASRGIGAAVAQALHQAGAQPARACRSGDAPGSPAAAARPSDVRDPEAIGRLVSATAEKFGGIDIVVVNAGVGSYGPFLEMPFEELEEIIDTNVKGALYTVRAALPHLMESDAADLVMLSSEAGRRSLPFEAVYCASKFAQVGLIRALDHELREKGVRCTNVAPGGVATDFAMGRGR